MDIFTVENGKLVCYRRAGECNKCGECCCTHTITYQSEIHFGASEESKDDHKGNDWSDREGWHIFFTHGTWWYFKITKVEPKETACESFRDGLCDKWMDTVYFKPICRYWPFHPSNLEHFPNCGFSFEKIDE